jgi:hypothetical protein
MGLEENKVVVQRLFDAINNGSLDELPEVPPDVGRPQRGHLDAA